MVDTDREPLVGNIIAHQGGVQKLAAMSQDDRVKAASA